MHSGRGNKFTVLNQSELGGAATNVDVQNAVLFIVRTFGRTRAVHSQHGFHVVAGCGAYKLAALLCQNSRNRFAVFAPQRLARQNDGTSINFIGVQTRLLVSLVNDGAQCFGVHQTVAQIRR